MRIREESAKLGIHKFEMVNRQLSLALLSGKSLSSYQKSLLDEYIFSGTYGTLETRINKAIPINSNISKIRYLYNRIVFPAPTLKELHPFFFKYKLMRPIMYSVRITKTIMKSPNRIIRELIAVLHR